MGRFFSRRDFVRTIGMGGAAAFTGAWGSGGLVASPRSPRSPGGAEAGGLAGNPLRIVPPVPPSRLVLDAAPGLADVGGGVQAEAWLLNGMLPSPLLRTRRGETFEVEMVNHLPDPLILHWHGLTPPEEADGHPRFAVPPGGRYAYRFEVENRAGTYWYHSHAHHLTAEHTYRGIAGLLLVEDEDEQALELPSGDREIALVLQDRRLDARGRPIFGDGSLLEGYMGDQPFANGIHNAHHEVETALYRLRILNGSNARIFRLGRSDGRPLLLIGNDGGFVDPPRELPSIDAAPGERLDLLLDLREAAEGDRVVLRSLSFDLQEEAREARGSTLQGSPLDLVEFRVVRQVRDRTPVPARLPAPVRPDPADAVRERTFLLTSELDPWSRTMMHHQINGREFQMGVVDEHVPFGDTEIWTFVNDNAFAHPIHMHATHFRVLSRSGGRNRVMPWEEGLKDTVLLHPDETVTVAIRFTAHRGLFPLHCHILEHEDVGMMLNVLVE